LPDNKHPVGVRRRTDVGGGSGKQLLQQLTTTVDFDAEMRKIDLRGVWMNCQKKKEQQAGFL
jgi:hypothetical protein